MVFILFQTSVLDLAKNYNVISIGYGLTINLEQSNWIFHKENWILKIRLTIEGNVRKAIKLSKHFKVTRTTATAAHRLIVNRGQLHKSESTVI